MKYLNTEIKHLTLELTNRCFLNCLECSRNSKSYQYQPTDITLAILNNLFTDELLHSLSKNTSTQVTLCGNYGDPIYHPHFHQMIHFLKQKKLSLEIITNGSHRDERWWKQTIEELGPKDRIIFSIDGDQSTNQQYRKGTDWESIITGIKIASSKCHTIWKCIAFDHNSHQFELLKKIAKELGVQQFMINYSGRTTQAENSPFAAKGELFGAKLSNKQLVKREYKAFQSKPLWKRLFSTPKIRLKPQCRLGREIYVSADGHLLPCCSAALYPSQPLAASFFDSQKNFFDLKKVTINAIIGAYNMSKIEKATSSAKNAPYICIKRCGVLLENTRPEELKRDDQIVFDL